MATKPSPVTELAGTTTTVAPSELRTYHRNPRRGDIPVIAASLRTNDQYRPVVVNIGTHTGRPNEVLAGNHTLLAIRELAEQEPDDPRWRAVKAHWGDWDDDQCRRIVLADNRTAELGGFDAGELLALLEDVPPVDLSAIGYTSDDLADLRAVMEEQTDLTIADDGLIDGDDLANTGASYGDRLTTRMMVLVWPIPQFVWAQAELEKYRAEHGIENNAAAVLSLLAAWSNDPIPSGPAPDET